MAVPINTRLTFDNLTDLTGATIQVPTAAGGNARHQFPWVNVSNPENYVDPIIVDAANSVSGLDVYYIPIEGYHLNVGERTKWRTSLLSSNLTANPTDGDYSFILALILTWSGAPNIRPFSPGLMAVQLRPWARLFHSDATTVDNQYYIGDEIIFRQAASGNPYMTKTLNVQNGSYQTLSLTALRSTLGNANVETTIPEPWNSYTAVQHIELELTVNVQQTNGGLKNLFFESEYYYERL